MPPIVTRRAVFTPRFNARFSQFWLAACLAFLYLPILTLIIYSFSDSRVANQWGGFTLKWYASLAADHELINGVLLSLKIAFASATGSAILGLLAAFTLVKYPRFKGRTLFSSMVNAPLVMPDVVVGLSLLLMLVSLQRWLGFPERGMLTIGLGHMLVGMAYATVVLQGRLRALDPRLEEAAMDLGARPSQVFMLVTLPAIVPSLLSAWLLTFSLSLDDVVLSAFLSGPGSSTLPLVVFSRARLGLSPAINAVATVTVVVVATCVVLASWYMARRAVRMDRELAHAARASP
ncbi:MAG: ABC transporter permease subunit [Comamonas sp.]